MTAADKVKVGFVGCGGIAEEHLKGLSKNVSVELAGFCDVNAARAEATAAKYATGSPTFTDARKMFSSIKIDAAYFCLPPFAHGSEMEAIRRGIPFFVEKPINLNLEQARKIASAARRKRVMTSAGYMNRYRQGVNNVKGRVEQDPAILVLGGWVSGTPQPGPSIISWWIQRKLSGGQFHEQVTHTVDLVRYICGEVVEVSAFPVRDMDKRVPVGFDIDNASVVNLRLLKGGVVNLWSCCSANGGGGGVNLSIYCNESTAIFSGWEHSLRLLQAGKEPIDMKGEPDIFRIEDDAFIDAVRKGDENKVRCSYGDAMRTLEVTLAANNSMALRRPMKLKHKR